MKCKILRSYKIKRDSNIGLLNKVIDLIENHSLFNNQFFEQYSKCELSKEKEKEWLLQRSILSKNFPRYYANIISKSSDLEFIKPLVDQLWEELGNGQSGELHYDQLVQSLNMLGISNIDIYSVTPNKSTQRLLESYHKWTGNLNPIVGAGIFGIAIEPIISMDCTLSLKGLNSNHVLSKNDLRYFIDHEGHDYRHSFEILDVVFPRISSEHELDLIFQGASEILNSRELFYNELI